VKEVIHGLVATGFDQERSRPDKLDLDAVAQLGRGLNNETMVEVNGLEPSASTLRIQNGLSQTRMFTNKSS
jgi:hypothetical protein